MSIINFLGDQCSPTTILTEKKKMKKEKMKAEKPPRSKLLCSKIVKNKQKERNTSVNDALASDNSPLKLKHKSQKRILLEESILECEDYIENEIGLTQNKSSKRDAEFKKKQV